jgi:2'-5' RNA ligase
MLWVMDTHEAPLRQFFALWPSARDARAIMDWAHDAHRCCGGRIMRQDTLHITLAFLGETSSGRACQLIEAAPCWPAPVGQVTLRRFGRFAGPRIVWAGPGRDDNDRTPWLDALHDSLWGRLQAMGWNRPASVFRPHVSLLRRAGQADLSALRRAPLAWTPEKCVLVASQPAQTGSYYKVLASMPIRG